MAPAHTVARLSTHLSLHPATLCIQCQFLASRPFSTVTPKLARRTSRPFSTLPPHLASRTLPERLWREPDSPKPESPSPRKAAGGVGEDLGQDEYKPAVIWDDLPSIGKNPGAEWERDNIWEGFMSPTKLHSRPEILAAIHRALIEVFTLRDAGLELEVRNTVGDDRGVEAMRGASLVQAGDGTVRVEYAHEELRAEVLASLTTAPPSAPAEDEGDAVETVAESELSLASDAEAPTEEPKNPEETQDQDVFEPEEPATHQTTADPPPDTWLAFSNAIPLDQWINTTFPSPPLKFAILKRTSQLTGRPIADPFLPAITSAHTLLRHLVAKPKPPKLAERLGLKEELVELPNVVLRERRWTPIDKEKEVGRWKVIEKELRGRGLPVRGH